MNILLNTDMMSCVIIRRPPNMDDYNHNAVMLAMRSRFLSLASTPAESATLLPRHPVPLPLLDDDEDDEVEDLRLAATA